MIFKRYYLTGDFIWRPLEKENSSYDQLEMTDLQLFRNIHSWSNHVEYGTGLNCPTIYQLLQNLAWAVFFLQLHAETSFLYSTGSLLKGGGQQQSLLQASLSPRVLSGVGRLEMWRAQPCAPPLCGVYRSLPHTSRELAAVTRPAVGCSMWHPAPLFHSLPFTNLPKLPRKLKWPCFYTTWNGTGPFKKK